MYDVVIVGGGVSGCSLLYALSRYKLKLALLEKTNDVGVATTKANSAILHAGYDPAPGTQMAKYNVRGNQLSRDICKRLDILMRETGSLVVGFDEADRATLAELLQRGRANGVPGLRLVEGAALREMEPNLAPEAHIALFAPTAAVVNPWELAFAQVEVAVNNGAEVLLNCELLSAQRVDGGFALQTSKGAVNARFVVNAAGVGAGEVARLFGPAHFDIEPNRGQYYLLDKSQGEAVSRIIFQCPTPKGKGVLVAPTVHGNLIAGPNSEEADDTATTAPGLAHVRQRAQMSVPSVDFRESIRNFAGLRAESTTRDFVVGQSPDVPGLFHMAGIKSPGLTAATAIAEDLVDMLGQAGLPLAKKKDFNDERHILRFKELSPAARAEAIQQNPLYGRIVCRCESITEGEVVDALRRPLPPHSLDAVKRRVGPGMGRCQGGFCGPRVQAIIARELGLPQQQVPQDREGMAIVTGRTKDRSLMEPSAIAAKGGASHE